MPRSGNSASRTAGRYLASCCCWAMRASAVFIFLARLARPPLKHSRETYGGNFPTSGVYV